MINLPGRAGMPQGTSIQRTAAYAVGLRLIPVCISRMSPAAGGVELSLWWADEHLSPQQCNISQRH